MQKNKRKSSQHDSGSARRSLHFGPMGHYLIENLPLGVVAFDEQLIIVDLNPIAERILAPDSNIAQALSAGSDSPGQPGWEGQLQQALAADKQRTFEKVSYLQNGRSYILQIVCRPLSDQKSGRRLGGLLLIEDITAKTAMQNDLAAAERLAAVGKLAARVAHELNNPLDGILRYINLALRVVEQNQQSQTCHYLQQARRGLLRMVQIISELLEFSRSTYSAFEEADINKILEDAVKAMESQAADNKVEIRRHYDPVMPNIRSGNLFQVFCNLVRNAIDAMENGGVLEITSYRDESHVLIEFADTGCGLSAEVKENLFEAFFTTKAAGKGTGLGLAICKDIVERYGGKIIADNRPGGGSVFTISIPLESTGAGSENDLNGAKRIR